MEERKFEGFVQKAAIFLIFLVLMLLFFYMVGNYQNFLDGTQRLLLQAEKTAAMLLAVCLVFTGAASVTQKGRKSGKKILIFLIFLAGAVLSVILSLFGSFILTWAGPPV